MEEKPIIEYLYSEGIPKILRIYENGNAEIRTTVNDIRMRQEVEENLESKFSIDSSLIKDISSGLKKAGFYYLPVENYMNIEEIDNRSKDIMKIDSEWYEELFLYSCDKQKRIQSYNKRPCNGIYEKYADKLKDILQNPNNYDVSEKKKENLISKIKKLF